MSGRTGALYWIDAILHDDTLDPTCKLVMLGLANHVGEDDECYVGIRTLAKMAGVSYSTVQRRLTLLERGGRIERARRVRDDGSQSVYQFRLLRCSPPLRLTGPPRSTGDRTPPVTQVTALNNPDRTIPIEEVRALPGIVPLDRPDLFDDFWAVFPMKKGKDAARKAWVKAIKRADPFEIIAGAQAYATDPNRDPQFTKYPQGWLNDGRWEDQTERIEQRRNKNVVVMEQARMMMSGRTSGLRSGDAGAGAVRGRLASNGHDAGDGGALGRGPGGPAS
jgi:hypothetical protein